MLHLAKLDGAVFPKEELLREKVRMILDQHTTCVPSLVHGDLWSGNQGYLKDGQPVIFDPATYVSIIILTNLIIDGEPIVCFYIYFSTEIEKLMLP